MAHIWQGFVGSYGDEDKANLHLLTYDFDQNEFTIVNAFTGLKNPSYLALTASGEDLYLISEQERGTVTHYKINQDKHTLEKGLSKSTKGSPCYLEVNEEKNVLLIANYGGGSIITYSIQQDGSLGQMLDYIGPEDMEASKIHTMRRYKESDYYMALDIGLSKLRFYHMNQDGKLSLQGTYQLPEHSGPREITFHPTLPLAYIVNEYVNQLFVLTIDLAEGHIDILQKLDTLRDDFLNKNYGAAIAYSELDQKVYLSNRGHHSITVYKVLEDGRLLYQNNETVFGEWPRHFITMDQKGTLMVANEHTNEVIVMKEGEKLQSIKLASPVCIQTLNYLKGGE